MAVAKKCDRCGKFYEGLEDRMYKTEDGYLINSIRIGDWDQKTRSWKAIGSAYDLCKDCGRDIYEAIFVNGLDSECGFKIRENKSEKVPTAKAPNKLYYKKPVVLTAEETEDILKNGGDSVKGSDSEEAV